VPARRLAAELGHDDVWIKCDHETGFALGGNKVRKLEYVLAPGRIDGATCLITAGGPQSNHCRITAAFAARAGLECVLVMQGLEPERPSGNALLHRLFGARIHPVPTGEDRDAGMKEAADRVRAAGGTPLVVPLGASTGLGALGYARAAVELVEQLDALGSKPTRTLVFVPTSSCGTLAGLVTGLALLGRDDVVPVGVSADVAADGLRRTTLTIAGEAASLVGLDEASVERTPFLAVDDQVGDGYGIPTEASTRATGLLARLEGVVLDPTYTAKAAAGMLDWVRTHGVVTGERIVFLHTGGHPALFA
jgi:1-aminocyclopropane-1-carboxylate deaminase/D-cysteine desulfhydrase-like pyridoxal-dependent ACC family enzyme